MNTFPIADSTLVDIVLFFAENAEQVAVHDSSDEVREKLILNGYTPSQIDSAFFVFTNSVQKRNFETGIRVFTPEELSNFEPEAASLVVKLQRHGLLSYEQIEALVMRAMIFEEKMFSLTEVKMMIAMMLSQDASAALPSGFFIPMDDNCIH